MSKQEQNNSKVQTASIVPKHVFGIRTDLQNCIQYFAPDKCAYIAGYDGVICMIKRNAQYFIPATEDYNAITSFSVDESNDCIVFFMSQTLEDKIYFIFRYINKTYLTIETGKTKTLYFQADKMQVVSSALNLSSGIFAALIGPIAPSMVVIYSLESRYNPKLTSKILLNASFPYTNININKYDTDKFAVWGDGGYAIINLNSKDTKPLEITASIFQEFSKCSFNIVACTWLSVTSVAFLNDSCDIMIMDFVSRHKGDNLAHKKLIKWNTIFETPPKGVAIFEKNTNLFVTRNDGFIVKLDNKCTKEEIVYEKASSSFKPVMNIPPMEVMCLSASKVSETTQNFGLLMATANGQIYMLDLSNDNAICDGSNYKYLLCSFHSDDITSIDVAKWKQLVASCSKDKSVRIWNYVNLQLEAMSTFEDEPLKVAFHPNGLHLAILFKDRVKVCDILEDSLQEFMDIRVFQPKDIKFSSFGTMISVCFKSAFQIYNFYTRQKIIDSRELTKQYQNLIPHTDEIKSLTWDADDTGFSTCGNDGRVIYWNISNFTQPIIYQRNSYFKATEIMTMDDFVSKKIFALDDNSLIEVFHSGNTKDEDTTKLDYDKDSQELQCKVVQDGRFSSMIFDQELKLLILSSPNDQTCSLSIFDYGKYMITNQKELLKFPANSMGIKSVKASSDMTYIFSGGNDRCLFFFNLKNVSKSADKRDIEIHEPENLILIPKEYLDKNAEKLREELNAKDEEIMREEEEFKGDLEKYKKELDKENANHEALVEDFANQKKELEQKIQSQNEYYENELAKIREEHKIKMDKLMAEQEANVKSKEDDKKTENKILKEEETKDKKNLILLNQEIRKDENNIRDEHQKVLDELNSQIDELKENHSEILSKIEIEKKDLMETNDKDIAEKRRELDKLKKYYEKTKQEHKEQEETLKKEIDEIRNANKRTENKRTKQKTELETLQQENQKLEKQIRDMQTDKNEKEETIKDKNELKRKLDKDNQELEKFKYVLHYKIKELKHNKEPKERKIQQMEKKAKDMEREIKSCELGQATIIIELSTNHQIIKIHEEQISKTEKRIEELRKYKKLFQENLYNSMKKARNHKDCKRELVLLKRNFLDKEKIDNIEKPFEANYELQREFLEKNVDHYKNKISKLNDLFVNDHNKVMKEKRQLIDIVNQLEKEKKEIEENEYKKDNVASITKPKIKLKADVPRFSQTMKKKKKKVEGEDNKEEDEENTLKELAEELKEIEKEIQWYKYWARKQETEKMNEKQMMRRGEDDLEY